MIKQGKQLKPAGQEEQDLLEEVIDEIEQDFGLEVIFHINKLYINKCVQNIFLMLMILFYLYIIRCRQRRVTQSCLRKCLTPTLKKVTTFYKKMFFTSKTIKTQTIVL